MPTHYDSRNNRWRYKFNQVINGQRVRVSKLLPKAWNRDQAKAFDQAETARIFGVATGAIKARILIQTAVDLYVDYRCDELKNGDGATKELARLFPYYDGRFLDELADVAREYTDAERERLAPASIRNKLSYLRAACRYAQKEHGIGDKNDVHGVPLPVVKNGRQVYVQRADMIRIARACEDRQARALIRLAFYSGMRLGEMVDLGRNSDVLDDGFLLRDTKNGESRIVPMHPRLRVVGRFLPFSHSKVWLQRLIRRAMDAAGFPALHFHDLRHSTASALINSDVSLHVVGAVLGHKDPRSTARYAHLARGTLNATIRKIR